MNDTEKDEASDPSRGKLRFSIGQLLVVTAIVSVVLMLLVTLGPPLWSMAAGSLPTNAFFERLFAPVRASGVLQLYFRRIPLLIVWVVAVVLLVQRRKQHPRVSLCALAGLGGLLMLELVTIGLSLWMVHWYRFPTLPPTLVGAAVPEVPPMPPMYDNVVSVLHYVRPVVEACSWALILMAVLGWRGSGTGKDKINDAE